jgi:hypothetical protein
MSDTSPCPDVQTPQQFLLGRPATAQEALRGPEALARLPAAKRQAWQELWAGVADKRARAQGTTRPEQRAGSRIPVPER